MRQKVKDDPPRTHQRRIVGGGLVRLPSPDYGWAIYRVISVSLANGLYCSQFNNRYAEFPSAFRRGERGNQVFGANPPKGGSAGSF